MKPTLTTTSLLRPLFCAPNELKFQSFPKFYNLVNPTTPLLRPHFHGPNVVALNWIPLLLIQSFNKIINHGMNPRWVGVSGEGPGVENPCPFPGLTFSHLRR